MNSANIGNKLNKINNLSARGAFVKAEIEV